MKRLTGVLAVLALVVTATVRADTLKIEILDLSSNPIPDVTIAYSYKATPPAVPGGGTLNTDADGRATLVHPGLGGSSCMLISAITYAISKPGFQFGQTGGSLPCGPVSHNLSVTGTDLPKMTSVSAASYEPGLVSEMIAAAFGSELATFTEFALSGLETNLAERTLLIRDARGVEKAAQLIFVSPTQINYVVPSDLSEGPALFKLIGTAGTPIGAQFAPIRRLSPGLFTANADGRGVAAAVIVRVRSGNVQSYEPVARLDEASGKFVAAQIDLGPGSDFVYLALFGTGWRKTASLSTVTVVIGGVPSQVEYAGKQPTIDGMDQINVLLSRELIGKGGAVVDVRIDGNLANLVLISIK